MVWGRRVCACDVCVCGVWGGGGCYSVVSLFVSSVYPMKIRDTRVRKDLLHILIIFKLN